MKLTVDQVWPYLECTMDPDFFKRYELDIEDITRSFIRILMEEPENLDDIYLNRYKIQHEKRLFAGSAEQKQEGNVAAIILHSVWRACHRAMMHAVTAEQLSSHPQSRLLPASPVPDSSPILQSAGSLTPLSTPVR